MILTHFLNASLLSLFYPLSVFGVALLEESRPGKQFWRVALGYTISLLMLKVIVQLNLGEGIESIVSEVLSISVTHLHLTPVGMVNAWTKKDGLGVFSLSLRSP